MLWSYISKKKWTIMVVVCIYDVTYLWRKRKRYRRSAPPLKIDACREVTRTNQWTGRVGEGVNGGYISGSAQGSSHIEREGVRHDGKKKICRKKKLMSKLLFFNDFFILNCSSLEYSHVFQVSILGFSPICSQNMWPTIHNNCFFSVLANHVHI